MTRQAKVPEIVRRYYTARFGTMDYPHPIIREVYYPDRGWKRYPLRKRISRAWAINHLRPEGVTSVQLESLGVIADFTVAEIVRQLPYEAVAR